jgi:hypothetical protein
MLTHLQALAGKRFLLSFAPLKKKEHGTKAYRHGTIETVAAA